MLVERGGWLWSHHADKEEKKHIHDASADGRVARIVPAADAGAAAVAEARKLYTATISGQGHRPPEQQPESILQSQQTLELEQPCKD